MKSLKESLFSDNITTDITVNFDFVVDYVRDKVDAAEKAGIDIEFYQNTGGNYIVSFYSPHVKNAKQVYEQINIKFVIARSNEIDGVGVRPYIVFGIDDSFILEMTDDSERVLNRIKRITFDPVWSDQPDKLIKTIDGFFEGFKKIYKDKQPIITNSKQMTINNIGTALFYNKMKRCFKYPDLKKIN